MISSQKDMHVQIIFQIRPLTVLLKMYKKSFFFDSLTWFTSKSPLILPFFKLSSLTATDFFSLVDATDYSCSLSSLTFGISFFHLIALGPASGLLEMNSLSCFTKDDEKNEIVEEEIDATHWASILNWCWFLTSIIWTITNINISLNVSQIFIDENHHNWSVNMKLSSKSSSTRTITIDQWRWS